MVCVRIAIIRALLIISLGALAACEGQDVTLIGSSSSDPNNPLPVDNSSTERGGGEISERFSSSISSSSSILPSPSRQSSSSRQASSAANSLVSIAPFSSSAKAAVSSGNRSSSGGESLAILQEGRELYLSHCAACHADTGGGIPDLVPEITGWSNDAAELVEKIHLSMPPNAPNSCDLDCSKLTASYILAGYNVNGLLHPDITFSGGPDGNSSSNNLSSSSQGGESSGGALSSSANSSDAVSSASASSEAGEPVAELQEGRELYSTQCAVCHGDKGEGVTGLGSTIPDWSNNATE